MRIHAVTMTGFGPYRDTETVDFDAFDDDGIFLITGRTGAGKTSILDAITYALFGSIPRYDGTAGEKVRSDYIGPTDPCVVTLEFSTSEARYLVSRSPAHERPKLRGGGTTTAAATFELAVRHDTGWEVIESRLGNAETRVEEIVRLNAKQFLQVILLAQGQFQEFLVATSERRRDLLRMLFDTRRFSDYGDTLYSRARSLGAQLAASSTAISTNVESLSRETGQPVPGTVDLESGAGVAEWVTELAAAQQQTVTAATAARTVTQTDRDAARQLLDVATSTAERQARRTRSLARQAELEQQRAAIGRSRERLAEARRASLAWHAVEASRAARRAFDSASDARAAAEHTFRRLLPEAPIDPDSLAGSAQQLTEQQGSLRGHAEREQSLGGLEAAAHRSTTELEAFDQQVRADAGSRAALSTQLTTLKASLDDLEKAAGGVTDADHAVAVLAARHLAALAAQATTIELQLALEAQLAAGRDVTAASAARDAVRARQRAGLAGTLAQSLRPDEPCLVCGSSTHPSPAALADDHVDDDAVERAEAAYEQADVCSREADRVVDLLRVRLGHETSAAGDETREALALQLEAAELKAAQARDAAVALAAAKATRDDLTAEVERLDEAARLASDRHTALVAAQSASGARLKAAADSLTEARGTHASVADRLAEVQSFARATHALLAATTRLDEVAERDEVAAQALAEALADHQFDDADGVSSARLAAPEQAALESTIAAHDAETQAVATALASDDLSDLPDTPVDVGAPQGSFDAADAAHQAAIGAESSARRQLATIQGLADQVLQALNAAHDVREHYAVLNRLASTVRGQTPNTMKMMLETFALAAELEEIVTAANTRLRTMTGGRYEFLHSDAVARGGAQSGLALDVLDAYTGETRSPQSLSGGEKFQASLALALGLAEVLTNRAGGLRLDTLFIDEGFGSLDSDTLETTMATLDNLRAGGRTIGLISHVEAMKESIPAQLRVDQTEGGWSTIHTS